MKTEEVIWQGMQEASSCWEQFLTDRLQEIRILVLQLQGSEPISLEEDLKALDEKPAQMTPWFPLDRP